MQVKSIAECSKTFIKLPFVIEIFFIFFLSGRFTQVLLYIAYRYHMPLNPPPVMTFSSATLVMFYDSLYCKQYEPL